MSNIKSEGLQKCNPSFFSIKSAKHQQNEINPNNKGRISELLIILGLQIKLETFT